MRGPLALALLIAAASAASAQAPLVPDTPPPPPAPPVIATPTAPVKRGPAPPGVAAIVNGKRISRARVASEALKVAGPQVVSQMILIELINQEAAKQHVTVTPAQVSTRLAEIRQQAGQRYPGGLDFVLAQRHQTLAAYTDQLATELRVEALVGRTLPPTPSAVKYHARHLLIATVSLPPGAPGAKPPHTDAEALAIIAKAQADLKAGKSFESVVEQYTEDPSGKGKGGDLGIIDTASPLDAAFKSAALALKPGEVTATPVKSQFGYHLIKVDSTSAAPAAADRKLFADAAAAERRQQVQQNIQSYVQALRARSQVIDYLGEAPTFAPAPAPGR